LKGRKYRYFKNPQIHKEVIMIVWIKKTPEIDELKKVVSESITEEIEEFAVQVRLRVCEPLALDGYMPSRSDLTSSRVKDYNDGERVYVLSLENLCHAVCERNLDLGNAIFARFARDTDFILSADEVEETGI